MWVFQKFYCMSIFGTDHHEDTFLLRVENTTAQPYLPEDPGDRRRKTEGRFRKVVSMQIYFWRMIDLQGWGLDAYDTKLVIIACF